MRKLYALTAAILLAALPGFAQVDSLNYGPEPVGGISKVALPFYKINFSPAQLSLLQQKEIELIFAVDTAGVATLEDINGIHEKAIRDSLQRASAKVPRFYPRVADRVKENSLYFLQFKLPDYSTGNTATMQPNLYHYKQYAYEDYEYIHTSGRLDILLGAAGNAFLGAPSKYLQPGGGMKVDMLYTGGKGFGAGMVMSFYGNKLKQNYPIASNREPNSVPPTLLIGLAANKILKKQERKELHAQLELSYAVQNITPKQDAEDEDWVQLQGFSPGLVLNYLIKLGKDRTSFYYGQPSIINHHLNLHGAVRPVFFNLKEATGVMVELGVSYRLTTHLVDEYRLKQ